MYLFEFIAMTWVKFCYALLNAGLRICRFLLFFRNHIPSDVTTVVIFRVGTIGDTICAIPAMVAVRRKFPKARLILLSSTGKLNLPGAQEILNGASFLDELVIYRQQDIATIVGCRTLIKKMKRKNIDLFVELPQDLTDLRIELRNMFFAKFIGCQYALGFNVSTLKMLGRLQSKHIKFDNEVERLLKIIAVEGIKTETAEFLIPVSKEDCATVKQFVSSLKTEKLVAINPNAKRQTNLWPLERFAEVGKWLVNAKGYTVIILGGKNDIAVSENLQKRIGETKVISAAGKFSVKQSIELLKYCRCLISNDTGTVHMAAAVGTQVVGIYSAWQHHGKWYPYGNNNVVLQHILVCHTCFRETCDQLNCLTNITVNQVTKVVDGIINKGDI